MSLRVPLYVICFAGDGPRDGDKWLSLRERTGYRVKGHRYAEGAPRQCVAGPARNGVVR